MRSEVGAISHTRSMVRESSSGVPTLKRFGSSGSSSHVAATCCAMLTSKSENRFESHGSSSGVSPTSLPS
eukprot:3516723-Prymnesium_polylepis.1